jgi:hypothetical protein
MVHVELTVTQFSPVETVIVAPLTAVKVTDRVATARVTVAVVVSAAIARPVCVTYPDLDAV